MDHGNPFTQDWSSNDQTAEGENIGALMQYEDWTNGVWNTLIANTFTYKDGFLVIPEFWFEGGKADLVVVHFRQKKPQLVLVYEGKKSGGATMAGVTAWEQVARCIKATSPGATPGIIYALGSKFEMTTTSSINIRFSGKVDSDGMYTLSERNFEEVQQKLDQLKKSRSTAGWK